jgi:hypothetical protein
LLLLGSLLTGCGAGTYNDLVEAAGPRLKSEAASRGMTRHLDPYIAEPVAETTFVYREPQGFQKVPADRGAHELYAASVPIPGHVQTYELGADRSGGSKTYVNIYVAAAALPEGGSASLMDAFQSSLKSKMVGAPEAWTPIDMKTPDGGSIPWKKYTMKGSFEFVSQQGSGSPYAAHEPGVIEYYWYEGNGHYAIVGWQRPDALESSDSNSSDPNVEEIVHGICGTIKINDAVPVATPSS